SSVLDRSSAWLPGDNAFGAGDYPGDVWLTTGRPAPEVGNRSYQTIRHELGHALGLKHGHERGGPGRTAVPADRDSLEFTVMTYRSFEGGPLRWSNEEFGFPQSFMMLDIAALQEMYGANYDYNSGNTTYRWHSVTGEMSINGVPQGRPGGGATRADPNNIFLTIWDGGGRDTYDMSNYGNGVSIDLEPGSWSVLSPDQLAFLGTDASGVDHFARGNVFNALPDPHQAVQQNVIENAIGGAGDDTIKGNTAGNHLDGRGGSDTLSGLDGRDTLSGGDGDDELNGGNGTDQLNGGNGVDQLNGG
ncbi:hypothetical protein FS320_44275, partial [Microvirga tunisiensis]|nr:hypothetical protein [Microvirga tunisiensis]